MSNNLSVIKTNLQDQVKSKFIERCSNDFVNYDKEESFAMQLLSKNPYLQNVALSNRASLSAAMLNVANIGITLNPALSYAYLVPRERQVCLDLSYKGYVYIACRSGYIKNVVCDVVKEGDKFIYKGKLAPPEHIIEDIFSTEVVRSEKKTIGAYCVAILPDNTYMVETMDLGEIEKVRNVSSSYKSFLSGKSKSAIWDKKTGWYDEMVKKSVIKKAAKLWISGSTKHALDMSGLLEDHDIEVKRDNASRISDIIDGNVETIEVDDNLGWDEFEGGSNE